ncbi:Alpha,alpha-trehalose-phosphate synthase [Fusarium oxysporum f. sp. albedinis]|nr:Alpha,alpha-trehalose-phosphate synthase [Fusarium oxysporum f. sp. albedinis]
MKQYLSHGRPPTVTAHSPPNPCEHASPSDDVHLLDPNPGHSPGTRHREAIALYLRDRDPCDLSLFDLNVLANATGLDEASSLVYRTTPALTQRFWHVQLTYEDFYSRLAIQEWLRY